MKAWYDKKRQPFIVFLLPFSWLFGLLTALRRWCYRYQIFKTHHFQVPVIVVGNITVGGTGKTPFVISLAQLLQAQGYRPGIVSRGVGGRQSNMPRLITSQSVANEVGDEALLLQQKTQCPMVVCIDRVAAVRKLLRDTNCNIVISDDGLQHYRLGRALEIVMVDNVRQFGNQYLLPAGPLREPVSRLRAADFVVINGGDDQDEYTLSLQPKEFVSLSNPDTKMQLNEFENNKVHAVVGIGHPERFFKTLNHLHVNFITHVFPDHHLYQTHELQFADNLPVVMTEKDAVKCAAFATERYWYLSILARMNEKLEHDILRKLKSWEMQYEHETDFASLSCRAHAEQPECIRRD